MAIYTVTPAERAEFGGSVVLAKFVEQRQAERLGARRVGHSLRRFDAAVHSRLTASWVSAERSINTELRGDLDALRRRARDLAKNSVYARKFLRMVSRNVVGPSGFSFQSRAADGNVQDDLANNAIEAGFADWAARYADITRRMSFRALCAAVVKGIARDGEALVRIIHGADNPYRYALQLLDVERLDTTLNREADQRQNAIIMGVEIDGVGRPVAYHLRTAPFGRDADTQKHARIPAAEILHLYMTDDPEQVRGIPWMHAAMLTTNDLKGYNQAAIIAARIGASKMGFFTNPEGQAQELGDGEDADGVPFTEVQAGQFGVLPNGYDFKSFDPDYPHANYAAFVKEHKRDIATGFDVAYNTLANDLEGVNFSSIRSGTLEERDGWMEAQGYVIEALLDPVHAGWLDSSLLAGALVMPNGSALPATKRAKFAAHQWQGRRWAWVDPLKDIEASVKAIENGLASPYSIAAQQGVDAEDVLRDIARFQATAKALNVTLGSPAPSAPQPADPPPDDGSKTLNLAMAKSLIDQRAAAQPITVAPVIHTPEVRNDITVHPAAAPEVRVDVAAPSVTVEPPAVEVRVDAVMPEQPAPVVEVNVEAVMPDTMKTEITAMPTRTTTTEIERNSDGEIIKSAQIERDTA